MPNSKLSGAALEEDLLKGYSDIAEFTLGDGSIVGQKTIARQVEKNQFPVFRIGRSIYARKSVLLKWIAEQEALANKPRSPDSSSTYVRRTRRRR